MLQTTPVNLVDISEELRPSHIDQLRVTFAVGNLPTFVPVYTRESKNTKQAGQGSHCRRLTRVRLDNLPSQLRELGFICRSATATTDQNGGQQRVTFRFKRPVYVIRRRQPEEDGRATNYFYSLCNTGRQYDGHLFEDNPYAYGLYLSAT